MRHTLVGQDEVVQWDLRIDCDRFLVLQANGHKVLQISPAGRVELICDYWDRLSGVAPILKGVWGKKYPWGRVGLPSLGLHGST